MDNVTPVKKEQFLMLFMVKCSLEGALMIKQGVHFNGFGLGHKKHVPLDGGCFVK